MQYGLWSNRILFKKRKSRPETNEPESNSCSFFWFSLIFQIKLICKQKWRCLVSLYHSPDSINDAQRGLRQRKSRTKQAVCTATSTSLYISTCMEGSMQCIRTTHSFNNNAMRNVYMKCKVIIILT